MTGKLILLGDLLAEPVAVADRPPEQPRDEREAMRAFIQREHEQTDLVRLRHGLDALYIEAGECCDWRTR